jgi:hypothetical protein
MALFDDIFAVAKRGDPATRQRREEVLGWIRDYKRDAAMKDPGIAAEMIGRLREPLEGAARLLANPLDGHGIALVQACLEELDRA